ncbi:hypothetical protein [Variovorax sp. KK3]|uniref:hypothetical protein n=1 Tax=Variovorax sp. KK3 TaxID=1855728 RepID=UPI00097C9F82|nr:hypothetical protein [Variovorax sp. KK3]
MDQPFAPDPSARDPSARDHRPSEGSEPARAAMRTEPLPLTPYGLRRRAKRFATRPFLGVLGYYALGMGSFAAMAAVNLPGSAVSVMVWQAAMVTAPVALAMALAAGRWWV